MVNNLNNNKLQYLYMIINIYNEFFVFSKLQNDLIILKFYILNQYFVLKFRNMEFESNFYISQMKMELFFYVFFVCNLDLYFFRMNLELFLEY